MEKFDEKTKNNAEQEMQRGVPKRSLANATSSASKNSISQNEKKSTPSAKKSESARKSTAHEAKLAEGGVEESIVKLGEGKIESVAGRDAKAGERRASVPFSFCLTT